MSKSWRPAVIWRTEFTVWNIEPTGSSQNQKSLNRDLPTELEIIMLLLLLIIVFPLEVKSTTNFTLPIISEASSWQIEEPQLILYKGFEA